eukprot:Nk52_evm8s166 gene=Nk52_evmTU8s166
MVSTSTLTLSTCAALVVGYWVYFDHKRRSDPDYKKKVRARKLAAKKALEEAKSKEEKELAEKRATLEKENAIPNTTDPEQLKAYFLDQIQKGEVALQSLDLETACRHFANSILVSDTPKDLAAFFQEKLPAEVFQGIMQFVQQAQPQKK